jgi:ABC-type dipeptide/oligopeptide/nickel transport system permease component
MFFALAIGIITGTIAALNHGGPLDYAISAGSSIALGIPNFWFGTMLIILFALWIRLVPPAGRAVDNPVSAVRTLILPMCALGLELGAILSKYTKNSLLEVLGADYVRTARAKGLPGAVILYKHALRTALGPLVTIMGIELARLLGGAVVVENVFAWPGMGRLMVQSLAQRDYLVLQAVLLLIITVFVVLNLLVDLSYLIIDPRVVLTDHGP